MVKMSIEQIKDYILTLTTKCNRKFIDIKLYYNEYNKYTGDYYFQDIIFIIQKESFKKLIGDFLVNLKHICYNKERNQIIIYYNEYVKKKRIDFLFELSSNSKSYKN